MSSSAPQHTMLSTPATDTATASSHAGPASPLSPLTSSSSTGAAKDASITAKVRSVAHVDTAVAQDAARGGDAGRDDVREDASGDRSAGKETSTAKGAVKSTSFGVEQEVPREVPEAAIRFVDRAVRDALPSGSTDFRIRPWGRSFFHQTARIDCVSADGTPQAYFLKVTLGDIGRGLVQAEYRGTRVVEAIARFIVPTPIAAGTYSDAAPERDYDASQMHFYLCEFVEMTPFAQAPSIDTIPYALARFHHRAVNPTGLFGFEDGCYIGKMHQDTTWTRSWEDFFARNVTGFFDLESQCQGADPEIDMLREKIMTKVIPRLLRPLQEHGRSIQPRLLHTDLWEGNCAERTKPAATEAERTQMAEETRGFIMYDVSVWYGHNECDLAPWYTDRHFPGTAYIERYFSYFPASEPVEDRDDRGRLYAMRFDMISSACYPGNQTFRKLMVDAMRYLTQKYPDGYVPAVQA